MEYFHQKNLEFYLFLNETFKINKAKRWSDISQQVTLARISATYKLFSKLYPVNVDYTSKLKSESNTFRSIHYNTLNPNKIINEIVRYSLYSDEIIVFHPLQNPAITNQSMNPIKDPKYWLQNFMDSLYFYIVLQKWVKAGIVKLIVNPSEYDFKLRNNLDSKASLRVRSLLSNPETEKVFMEEAEENLAESLSQSFVGSNLSKIKNGLLNMESPKYTEEEADKFALKIFSKLNLKNPLYEKLNVPSSKASLIVTRGGGNLESILHVAEITNGNIYTTNKSNWHQISQLDNVGHWTKIAHLYSKIEIPFLNDVETSFALNLREEDRLSGVRIEFRKIYDSINSIQSKEINERMLRDLNEGLIDAIKRADKDFEYIKKSAQNKRLTWAAANVASPLVFQQVSILPILLGSSIWLASNIRDEVLDKRKSKSSNPLSVFVDLQHQQPNFFSELKNCIF